MLGYLLRVNEDLRLRLNPDPGAANVRAKAEAKAGQKCTTPLLLTADPDFLFLNDERSMS
jgi:hypothetical protein